MANIKNSLLSVDIKQLFLIDAIGATVSALIIGVFFSLFNDLIGIPIEYTLVLASIPSIFSINSFLLYYRRKGDPHKSLKTLAILNLFYCILSAVFVICFWGKITTLGSSYFIAEIIIVLFLSIIELKKAVHST